VFAFGGETSFGGVDPELEVERGDKKRGETGGRRREVEMSDLLPKVEVHRARWYSFICASIEKDVFVFNAFVFSFPIVFLPSGV
jgi:hypothetical protein